MESALVQPREPTPAQRVLIVDDNDDARFLLAGLLAAHGYEVESAGEADGALQIAARFRPQVVVLDIGLPGIDGWELARRLRGIAGLERIRLVALTGYGSERDRQRSREAGIDEHLLKPIEVALLTRAFA
ncbi:MAG TPA: response regulator [Kofleriaceae bacterium]|nr:response regulator [Kofleriaceae bacterium]